MQYHVCAFLLLVLGGREIVAGKVSDKLPSSFSVCKRNDPDLNECLRAAVQKGIGLMKDGVSELKIMPIDPLVVKNIKIEDGAGRPVNLKLNLNNVEITGLSGMTIKSFSTDLDKKTMLMRADIPYVKIEGDYTMDGKFLVLPMKGEGKCNMSMTELDIKGTLKAEPMEKNGVLYWDVQNFDLHTEDIKLFQVYFDNLFNGDKELGSNTNKVMNENWKDLYQELRPTLRESLGAVFREVANGIFHNVAEKDLFPES